MILYELINFEGSYQDEAKYIRSIFAAASKSGARWIEWSPAFSGIMDQPDVSIVSSRNMFPRTLNKIIESRRASIKAIYGPAMRGLDYLRIDHGFNASELEKAFLSVDLVHYLDEENVPTDAVYRTGVWQKTIPMPLPLAR